MDLKGKVVVITGGTSGIGLCTIQKFLLTEIKVIVLFELETPNSMEVFRDLQRRYGERIDLYPCDVTNTPQLEGHFDKVFEKYKAIDILINNAGTMSERDSQRSIDINYKAVVLGSLMMIDRVGKHKGGEGGLIINVASIAGLVNYVLPIYCSAKHAVVSFTRTMTEHTDKTGIRVIALCPGGTQTGLLDGIGKGLDFVNTDGIFEPFPLQLPENVAVALIKVIEEGHSGDVWVVEEDQPAYLVKAIEDYKSLRID